MCRDTSRPLPSSAPPSTSSCHGPHDLSSPRSRAAWCAQTLPLTCSLTGRPGQLLTGLLLDDSVCNARRHFSVLAEFHGERRASLAHRTHGGRVAKHLRQRHLGGDRLARGTFL